VVEEVGEGVQDLVRGDRVVMVFMPSCGHCLPCAEGRPALCEPGAAANGAGTLLSGARRLHCDGAEVNHHLGVVAFAEYATVSRSSLVKVDPDLPLERRRCSAAPCSPGGRRRQHGPDAGRLLGGVIGWAASARSVLGALAAGAREVVAVDLADDKLALARQLGATRLSTRGTRTAPSRSGPRHGGASCSPSSSRGSVRAARARPVRIPRRGGLQR
jgi:alcohol dehydrogenase